MKKILLDTNAYTRFLVGEQMIIDEIATADVIFLSVTSLGELFAGFKYGSKEKENRKNLEIFLAKPLIEVINVSKETAEVYAQIYTALKKAGTPVPTNDVWIAAHSIETGAKLITFDAHFSKIPGIRIWDRT